MNTAAEELALALGKAESCKFNTRTCSCLAQVLSGAAKIISSHSEKNHVNSQIGFFKLVHDIRKWMDLNTRPGANRVPRRALHNIWTKVNMVLSQVAQSFEINLSTAAPDLIEKYWEQDVIEQMVMKDLLCVVLWVQQDQKGVPMDESAESFINRFDTDNVAVFRVSSLTLSERLASFETRLSGAKFDGRIRMVVNVKDPVTIVKQILTHGFLRHVPMLVNTAGIESPEDAIYELARLKSDIQFSVKPGDFDKYCSFATILWINYKDDPSRTVVEKRVSKTGVVIQKTDSMEKGLRYMDAHGHLAYLNEFRIVIGNGSLVLDEAQEAAVNASKKREFFAQRAAAMRARGSGGGGKKSEEEFSTLELVQVIRNRQKWHTPILVYSYDGSSPEPELYAFKNLKAATDLETLEYFATMKALPWSVDLSSLLTNTSSTQPGILRIVNLRCNDLVPKKAGSSMDPFVIVKVGDSFEKKTKKMSSTLNPTWNLGWEIPCKLSDRITFQVLDKNFLGKNDFEGHYEGTVSDLIPVATPFVEVTKAISSSSSSSSAASSSTSKNTSVPTSSTPPSSSNANLANSPSASIGTLLPGTITADLGFRIEGQSEKVLGRLFGQPFEQTIDESIRDAVPHLIESTVSLILNRGLECEGIFRQPSNQKKVDNLRDQLDKGLPVTLDDQDPFDVAFLLRTYLKELPQPLLTRNRYQSFKACSAIEKRRDRLVALSDVLGQMPPHNLESFANIIHVLSEVAKYEQENKMTARNLATVLGPALVIPRDVEADPSTYLADTTAVASVLESCITYCHKLFQRQSEGDGLSSKSKKSKTSIRAFIDPYLTDSLSSPRVHGSGSSGGRPRSHTRALSDSVELMTRKMSIGGYTDWLRTDFILSEQVLEPEALDALDPYSQVPDVGENEEDGGKSVKARRKEIEEENEEDEP